jgi:hypothetical protein
LKVVGALDNYSLVFVIFINFFGQLKDWVGQVLFLVSCPKGHVEKYVNVEAWSKSRLNLYASLHDTNTVNIVPDFRAKIRKILKQLSDSGIFGSISCCCNISWRYSWIQHTCTCI